MSIDQQPRDEDVDRWFGMFRSVGHEPISEALYLAVRQQRRRRAREALARVLLGVGGSAALIWWRDGAPTFVGVVAPALVGPCIFVGYSGFKLLHDVRRLAAVTRASSVERFVGRVPSIQAYRDDQTNRLVRAKLVVGGREHVLLVHTESRALLAVDGAPVTSVFGHVVSTAALVPLSEGTPVAAPGERRPLSPTEVAELEALTVRSTARRWALAAAYASLATVCTACLVINVHTLAAHGWAILAGVFALVLLAADRLLRASAAALRARVDEDIAGGLMRGRSTWRLPVANLVWEQDGMPSVDRLNRGGLDGRHVTYGGRRGARPTTF